jgi:hypothetical protein
MSTDRAKVIDKLRKLRAHAESAQKLNSEAEAASFAEMVQTMITRHNIQESELDALEQEEELKLNPMVQIHLPHEFLHKHKQRRAWLEDLAACVAHAHFCDVLYGPKRFYIYFCGREAQAEMAREVYVKLATTAERLAQAEYFRHYHEVRGDGQEASIRGFKPAFLDAFVHRLASRYRRRTEQLQDEINAAAGAMVLFKSEEQKLKEFIDSILHPRRKHVKHIKSLFLEFGDKVRPVLKKKWAMGFTWGILQGEKVLLDLFYTENEAYIALAEEHSLQPAKSGGYHREGTARGQAAADKLNIGPEVQSKVRKQLE